MSARAGRSEVLRLVGTLYRSGTAAGLSDRELLDRYLNGRDGDAFAVLVDRHGAMVLEVCRRMLRDSWDAEDAFQATFLVLARSARTIRDRSSLGSWLYGTALRVAACSRRARQRREQRLSQFAVVSRTDRGLPSSDFPRDHLASQRLHDEIARLPEAYRAPLVLCGLEGRSCEDAATHLGWPVGTVKSRLARGRKKLRGRLSGVLHSSAVIAALSTSKQATFACVPNKLHVAVTSAAIQLITPIAGATGVVPVAVTLLSQEVLHAMFLTKLRVLGLFAAVALGVTTSVVLAAQSDDRPGQSDDRTSSSPRADRLESIEKKLDKLIEVLGDRAARTAPAPVVYGSADVHPAHPTPSVRAVPALPNPIPPGVAAAVPPPAAPIATPYSDAHAWPSPHPVPALAPADAASDHRVAELEKRVKDLEKRLEMLERALGELGDQPAARPVSPRQNTRADTRPAPTPGAR